MKRMRHLILPSFLALTAAFVAPGDSLAFHVEAKTKLTKTFASKLELHSTEMSITFDGQDAHGGMEGPKIGLTDEEHIEVTDEYVAVGDGRATKLKRTFDKLEGKSSQSVQPPEGMEGDPSDETKEKSSPLEGKSVAFAWKDDEWNATWPEGEKGDDDLLEKLDGDLDFAGFLPGKSVADGDTWDLDAKLFNKVLSPGGRLHLDEKKGEGEEGSEDDKIQDTIEENLGGKASATYKGVREVEGVKLSVIEVKAELRSSGTIDEDEGKAAIEATMDLEGEVLWDAKAGHLRSFKLSGKMSFSMESTRSMEFGDESHEFSQKVRFEGDLEHTAKFE